MKMRKKLKLKMIKKSHKVARSGNNKKSKSTSSSSNSDSDSSSTLSDSIFNERMQSRSKTSRSNKYINTSSQGGGSDEVKIDAKKIYSDNPFFGESNSEYYENYRNKTIFS